jgi:hypothetical protein
LDCKYTRLPMPEAFAKSPVWMFVIFFISVFKFIPL